MINNIAKRLVYRKAIFDDDAVAIADLVYQSNPTLYSYWFKTKDGIMEYFENRFNDPSFPFGFTNCFVAYEDTDEHDTLSDSVLGVIIGWHSGMDASYDFTTTPRLIRIVTEPSKPTSSLPYTMPGRTVMYLQSLESVFFRTIVDRLSEVSYSKLICGI